MKFNYFYPRALLSALLAIRLIESKLVEPKEATVGAMAKGKQGGKFYSGSIVAVGTKAEIEQHWKELEDSDSATTHDQGTFTFMQCVHACILRMYIYMYM